MKALSIQQPWAWLICQGFKNIENRSWSTNFRGPVLIHAGKRPDKDCLDNAKKKLDPEFIKYLMRSTGKNDLAVPLNVDDYPAGGIVGIMTITGCITASDNPWFFGDYGFTLAEARPLPFIPLRGQLGFFDVPDEIIQQLGLETSHA